MSCARAVLERVVCIAVGAATASAATLIIGLPPTARAQEGVDVALEESGGCPGLFVLGVQGTGQSSPNQSVAADAGPLSSMLSPLLETLNGRAIGRAYVPYSAGFGGAFPGTATTPYAVSAETGLARLRDMAADVAQRCPDSQLGMIGYSQGAHVVSMFAREVGAGEGSVPADRVAAVALLADPTRSPGAAAFPGTYGPARPEPAPGTTGAQLRALQEFPQHLVPGGGIGPLRDIADDFGELTGRVASLCLPGDLACDAPTDAPLLHMVVNIIGQARLLPTDPMGALSSIVDGFSSTLSRTVSTVVTHDLRGYSLGTLSLTPEKPLSVRLAEAADPRSGSEPENREALLRLGTSALNTLLAIIGIALEPAEVAAVVTAPDPISGIERAATAFVDAVRRPLPQRTVFNLFTEIFDALGHVSSENAELLDPALWLRYADTMRAHGDYFHAAYTADGRSAADLVATWFTAVAVDLTVHRIPEPAPERRAPAAPAPWPGHNPAPAPAPPTVVRPDVRNVAVESGGPVHPDATTHTAARATRDGVGPYLLIGLVLLSAVSAAACGAIRAARRPPCRRRVAWPGRAPAAVTMHQASRVAAASPATRLRHAVSANSRGRSSRHRSGKRVPPPRRR